MAENKQYITQVQENGNVMISEDVIEAIVAQTISEVEGVHGLDVKPGADIADLIGKSDGQGRSEAHRRLLSLPSGTDRGEQVHLPGIPPADRRSRV